MPAHTAAPSACALLRASNHHPACPRNNRCKRRGHKREHHHCANVSAACPVQYTISARILSLRWLHLGIGVQIRRDPMGKTTPALMLSRRSRQRCPPMTVKRRCSNGSQPGTSGRESMRIPYTPPRQGKIPATGLSPVLWISFGAHRKHDILPMDFRSSPENGHSRYGNRTARFAPNRTRDGVQHRKRTSGEPALARTDLIRSLRRRERAASAEL